MKEMSLMIKIPADIDNELSSQQIVFNIVKNFIFAAHEKGLGEEQRRIYYKLCDDFEIAIKENKDMVMLEDDRAKLIKISMSKAVFTPNDLTRDVERLIDEIKNIDIQVASKNGNGTKTELEEQDA